ncbi:MAG TPA: tail fiber domain-containing protein [Candidatus Omnitrophota bacterium]|nr:tail fiber domain-containing protein [Candidatus Omnitrophota bacterium]HPD84568.1 tail fiber domain-containing protein [Candidatus Omnitrophota bacterium]HRZ03426.1 tail fiber domain-containing protein [Candidatus Omnitrophota bacterium]
MVGLKYLIILAVLLIGIPAHAQTESMTMTTYYPAPLGFYNQMRLVPRIAAPGPCDLTDATSSPGLMWFDQAINTLKICQDDGTGAGSIAWMSLGGSGGGGGLWTRTGNNLYPANIGDRVGIGTDNPGVTLDVVGQTGIRINDNIDNWPARIRMVDTVVEGAGTRDDLMMETDGGLFVQLDNNNNGISGIVGFGILDGQNNVLVNVLEDNGNVGIGTGIDAPTAKLQVKDGVVLFDGDIGSTPVSGVGTRFMWIPEKHALRAGHVAEERPLVWDDANIGMNSFAAGLNPEASGAQSIALGQNVTAQGQRSVALNSGTQALGLGSLATGGVTQATADWSTAMGFRARALHEKSFAIGLDVEESEQCDTTAEGQLMLCGEEVVLGNLSFDGAIFRQGATLYGNQAATHVNLGTAGTTGDEFLNNTYCTVSGGRSNQAKGSFSTVAGGENNYTLFNATHGTVSGGRWNSAQGDYATSPGGWDNDAMGQYSFAAGREAKADDVGSFVWSASSSGAECHSSGDYSFTACAPGGVFLRGEVFLPNIHIGPPPGSMFQYSLYMNENFQVWRMGSSKRYKKDISDLEINSEKIYGLRPVSFTWISGGQRDFGLIAEETEAVMPELVSFDKDGTPESVRYDQLPVLLLNEIKKLNERITVLEQRLEIYEK